MMNICIPTNIHKNEHKPTSKQRKKLTSQQTNKQRDKQTKKSLGVLTLSIVKTSQALRQIGPYN